MQTVSPSGAKLGPGAIAALGTIMAAMAAAFALRLVMARGDLWLDEVWSLDLVRPLRSSLGVFTDISCDNNHFLNSLWLFWLGPTRGALAYRAPAIVLGTASVGLAGAVLWRRNRASAVAAALLAAAALPLVVYGSEARGYAGLIAMTLLAFAACDRAIKARPGSREAAMARMTLGAAIGIGTLFHLTMLATATALGLAAMRHFHADRPLKPAIDATLSLFRPALLCLLPAAAATITGILRRDGFTIGNTTPASLDTFLHGYGDEIRFTLGLPTTVPPLACLVGAALIVVVAQRLRPFDPAWRSLAVAALAAFPAAVLCLRLPNLEFARYYLVSGLVLLLAMADLAGTLWRDGTPARRVLAAGLLGLALTGQLLADVSAIQTGRGRYGDALAAMADASGRVRYGTPDPFWIRSVAEHAARSRGLVAVLIAESDLCRHPPDWIIEGPTGDAPPSRDSGEWGPPSCRLRFDRVTTVPANPLSGMPWTVYAHADGPRTDRLQAASRSVMAGRTPY